VQVRNTAGTTLATVMNVCSNSGVWTQRTFNLASYAGQTVVLWFNVHDDGWPTDPSYMLVDDILVQ
jgi:bacillopeptidase F (M6 metalloprotease family)